MIRRIWHRSERKSGAVLAGGLLALLCSVTAASAQVEIRLRVNGQDRRVFLQEHTQYQDQFFGIDPTLTREALQGVEIEADILAAVEMLGSDDYAQREAATAQLLDDDERRLQMVAALARENLETEQRCRLLQIIQQQLLFAPRGALGIQMERPLGMIGGPGAQEIKITGLIANFPAERVLQVGDRITAIDGEPLIRQEDLVARVQTKQPGDMVSVSVRRPKVDDKGKWITDATGQPVMDVMTFEFPLGSADRLERESRTTPSIPSPVLSERRGQAQQIMNDYRPEPEVIRIKGGAAQLAHEDDIDRHPAIITLRDEQARLQDWSGSNDAARREYWEQTLTTLRQLANSPGLSERERDRMRRVVERYLQLMNAGS